MTSHFFDGVKSVNLMFLFPSIIDLKNACKTREMKLSSKHEVYRDSLGRLMLSEKILSTPVAKSSIDPQVDSLLSKLLVTYW